VDPSAPLIGEIVPAAPAPPLPALPAGGLPDAAILAGQLRPRSRAIYSRDVAAYAAWAGTAGRDPRLPETLVHWRTHLADGTDLAPATINRMLAACKRLMKEGGAHGLVDPAVAFRFSQVEGVSARALKERTGRRAGTLITATEMRRICAAPDPTTLHGLRDRAFLHVLASSAARISEVCTLRFDQIHAVGSHYLLAVTGKTDLVPRDAPLSTEAYQAIMAWRQARALDVPAVFTRTAGQGHTARPEPLTPQAAWLIVRKYGLACGVAIKPHDFRRAVLTDATARLGIRVAQKIAGHKNIATTAHYDLQLLQPGLTDGWY